MIAFKTEKITKRVTRIFGVCTELMYLVEGDYKAALIDTGSGFGSLKNTVKHLTDKPVIVLLTHGHTDHAMGAGEFEEVYMNLADAYIYGPHGEKDFRLDGLKLSSAKDDFEMEDYIPTADIGRFKNMHGGDSFNLGGEEIEVYDIPGHTKGSVAFLLKNERILITGDSCNNQTFMFQDYSIPITEYQKNLRILNKYTKGKYDQVLSSHGDGNLSTDIIESMIGLCQEIIDGKAERIPFEFRGEKGWLAKETDPVTGIRKDGKSGNIVYPYRKGE